MLATMNVAMLGIGIKAKLQYRRGRQPINVAMLGIGIKAKLAHVQSTGNVMLPC